MNLLPLLVGAAALLAQQTGTTPPAPAEVADPAAAKAPDPRIQTILYDPEQVVTLEVALGYALTVEFAADERIENIVVGNSAVWQVTPNRRGDHLFIKPMQGATVTNMEVISNARRYSFLLQPGNGPMLPFSLRFRYASVPPEVETIVPAPEPTLYRLTGDPALCPDAISDDGVRTTIHWPAGKPLPAVYTVDARGREAIVNGRMVGENYVVEAIASRFLFRADGRHAAATRRTPRKSR